MLPRIFVVETIKVQENAAQDESDESKLAVRLTYVKVWTHELSCLQRHLPIANPMYLDTLGTYFQLSCSEPHFHSSVIPG